MPTYEEEQKKEDIVEPEPVVEEVSTEPSETPKPQEKEIEDKPQPEDKPKQCRFIYPVIFNVLPFWLLFDKIKCLPLSNLSSCC